MTFILLYIFSYITIASAFSNRDVTFAAPLLDYGYAPTVQEFQTKTISNKPILLYLPGFDGTYICPFIQFPELGILRHMTLASNDTSFCRLTPLEKEEGECRGGE